MGGTLCHRFPITEGTSVSYRNQGGSDFPIYTAPPAPRNARELVDEQGVEAVRVALPEAERQTFDEANPWRAIARADERLAQRIAALEAFDRRLQQHITDQGYTPDQAEVVFAQTAELRQPLEVAVSQSQQSAHNRLNTYREGLIAHIDNRGLTQAVAVQTGHYSMPELSTAEAASLLQPQGSSRQPNRHGHSGEQRPALRDVSGNRLPAPRR